MIKFNLIKKLWNRDGAYEFKIFGAPYGDEFLYAFTIYQLNELQWIEYFYNYDEALERARYFM